MNDNKLERAVHLLRAGEVVAMPTETVYGLGAAIDSVEGINKIFSTKKRPFFDPLIVHVSSKKMAKTLTSDWHPMADFLAEHFWPGPLTLILPKADSVNQLITSGLSTVGIRMPKHSIALSLIDLLSVPIAAPSANLFGKTSPTSASHVEKEFEGQGLMVLDGGPCEVGLESTVLLIRKTQEHYQLSILRSGHVLRSDLEKALSVSRLKFEFVKNNEPALAPGQLKHHYMPEVPLVLIKNKSMKLDEVVATTLNKMSHLPAEVESVSLKKISQIKNPLMLELPEESHLAARQLYSKLRELVEIKKADFLYFYRQEIHSAEEWESVMDRLTKAATFILE